MRGTTLLSASLLVASVSAFWRMPCRSATGYARLDPIMNPGTISDHVHAIHGGGNFGWNSKFADLTAPGSCTSCEVTQDKSAYWTPALYFMYDNGTTVMVPQVGGMLAYYLPYLDNITAFPTDFQMIAGNKNLRHFDGPFPDTDLSSWPLDPSNNQFFLEQRALGFNCLNYAAPPEGSLYRHTFPTKQELDNKCKDGLRLELAFPSCGTGASDSPDHRSHVAYPSLVKTGNCPKGYDVHYPFLFFETIWATNVFAGDAGQFVLSHGDPVGTGYHGDFLMGWDSREFLQQAIDTCTNLSGKVEDCPLFNLQSDAEAAKCSFKAPDAVKNEDTHGPMQGLPVSVPVQYGPATATKYPVVGLQTPALAIPVPSDPNAAALVNKLNAGIQEIQAAVNPAKPAVAPVAPAAAPVIPVPAPVVPVPAPVAPAAAPVAPAAAPAVVPSVSPAPVAAPAPVITAKPDLEKGPTYTVTTTEGDTIKVIVYEPATAYVTEIVTVDVYAKHRRHADFHAQH